MDPRLLRFYNRELQHLREMGGEFAEEFPKVAGRLGMEKEKVSDPYVERLLEGFAFMAARVQLKMDDEFPSFTQHLLQLVYPHFLSPLPSMAIAQFNPVLEESALAEGYVLPRDTALIAVRGRGQKTACEFRTGHALTLWPIEITEAKYFGTAGALASAHIPTTRNARAGIRLSLRTTAGLSFRDIALDTLRLHLVGRDGLAARLYEQLFGQCVGVVARPKGGAGQWHETLPAEQVMPVGFRQDESMLPPSNRSFDGYRVLQEYFAFPDRFLFADVGGLAGAVGQCESTELELIFLLERRDSELEQRLAAENFRLNCAPIINLFPKRADRVHLNHRDHEYHVVPDRTRPMDYEVWSIGEMQGFGSSAAPEKTFHPLYSHRGTVHTGDEAYFSSRRLPRQLSAKQRREGARSSYVGSEVYIALSGAVDESLRQVEAATLCTNRDLALHIPTGQGLTDFSLDTGAPVASVTCLSGPSRPRPSRAHGHVAWQLVEHLSLNYLSLIDGNQAEGAGAMRSLLSLYADEHDAAAQRQVEGLKSIESRTITARLPTHGPMTYGRGLEITLNCEEGAFEGTGLFLFGQVMDHFLAKFVSLNSFVQTVLVSQERGEVMRWQPRLGRRHVL